MRTPDQDELPGDGDSSQTIGEGFGGVDPEQLSPYGDDFYDEYSDTYDEDSDDESFGDETDDTDSSDRSDDTDSSVEDGDFPTGDVSEDEAEDILEDVLEESYGDEVAQELQEDSGMSALEILEDLTGLDLDSSDDLSYSSTPDFEVEEHAEHHDVDMLGE